jgi:hypothetical protein
VVAVADRTDTVAANVEKTEAKLDIVHRKVDGMNKAALENQALLSDRGGFDRGVEAMGEAVKATAPSEATPLVLPAYDARDAAPPPQQIMAWLGHENQEASGVFH